MALSRAKAGEFSEHGIDGGPPVFFITENHGLGIPRTRAGDVGDADQRDLRRRNRGRDVAHARIVGDDDRCFFGKRRKRTERRGRENAGVRTGNFGFGRFIGGRKDDRLDPHFTKRCTERVEVRPGLLFTVMHAARHGSKQSETFGDFVFFNEVAGARLVTRQKLQFQLRRHFIPCGLRAPGEQCRVREREEALHFVHFSGFRQFFIEEKATAVRAEAGTCHAADRKEQGGAEGIGKEKAAGLLSKDGGQSTDAAHVFRYVAFDGIEAPPHAGKQVSSPTLSDEDGHEAALLEQLKTGQRHAAVADVIGKSTENVGHESPFYQL